MFYWFSPFMVAIGQVSAIILFLLYHDIHAFAERPRRICLALAFFLVHLTLQSYLYSYSALSSMEILPTIQYILVTLLYYMIFVRLWAGSSLPACWFISLIFLLTDNCVWPLLVNISRGIWGINILYEGGYLLRLLSIALLWLLESAILVLIRHLLPPLSEIRLDKYNCVLTLASIIPFFYMRIFSSRFSGYPNKALQIIMTLCCLVALVTLVGGIGHSFHEYEMLRSAQMKRILECQQLQFRQKLQDIDAVNRKYHDMKNILLFLTAHEGTPEIRGQIQVILNDIRSYELTALTGNNTIDILLSEKLAVCQAREISCVPYLDGALLNFVEPLDLCTIFGNALDNAIESCEQISAKSDRHISIRTAKRGSSIALTFRNTFSQAPQLRNGLPLSTKTDKKNHGYGLGNIRYIMHKYQGELICRIEGQEFVLTLLFPSAPQEAGI